MLYIINSSALPTCNKTKGSLGLNCVKETRKCVQKETNIVKPLLAKNRSLDFSE